MHKQLRLVILFVLIISSNGHAQKLSIGFGFYDLKAKVGQEEASVSNLGAYKFQYHSIVQEKFELVLGYTLLIEDIVTGDKAFGPSIGGRYYLFGNNTVEVAQLSSFSVSSIKRYNPYLYLGFNQRQYQSIKSTYAGFSFGGGVEAGFDSKKSLFADIQISSLEGPSEGEATETSITTGIIFNY